MCEWILVVMVAREPLPELRRGPLADNNYSEFNPFSKISLHYNFTLIRLCECLVQLTLRHC
jgi:hypothetical protein